MPRARPSSWTASRRPRERRPSPSRTNVALSGTAIPVTVAWTGSRQPRRRGHRDLHAPAEHQRRDDVVDGRERPHDDLADDDRPVKRLDAVPRPRDRQGGQRRVLRRRDAVGPARPGQLDGRPLLIAVGALDVVELLRRIRPLHVDRRPLGELHVHGQLDRGRRHARHRPAARSRSTSTACSRRRWTRTARRRQYRAVVWRKTYPSTVTKTIRVVVLATSGRPRVDLDAFAVLK